MIVYKVKMTNINGVYVADQRKDLKAKRELSTQKGLNGDISVMGYPLLKKELLFYSQKLPLEIIKK